MGNFSNNAITDVGRILLADVQAGGVFTPTRIVIGSGSMPGGATAQGMTEVIHPVKSLAINKKKRTPDGKCVFGGVYTNEEITEPFYFRELAMYAKAVYLNEDGSVKSEGPETLYSYGNAGATADYMPAYSTSTVVEKQMDLVIWVGNETQVDLTIESGLFLTREMANGLSGDAKHLTISKIEDLDPIYENGWYSFILPDTTNVNGVNFQYGYMRVDNFDLASCTQTLHVVDAQGTILRRKKMNNTWGEFECENPPFALDMEYRTTERRGGKAVYKKLGSDGVLKYHLEGETAWKAYARESGAAPDGYGLGTYPQKTLSLAELDSVYDTGWYILSEYGTNLSGVGFNYANVLVHCTANKSCAQELRILGSNIVLRRNAHLGAWSLWDVENPPFDPDVEYRTTERRNGKVVYKKLGSDGVLRYRLDGETTWNTYAHEMSAAPNTLVHKVYDTNTNEAIDAVIEAELKDMPEHSIRHICVSDNVGSTIFFGGMTHLTINKVTDEYASVEAIRYHTSGVLMWKRCKYQTWRAWEWVNPPLDSGYEYRTTERYHGYAVIKKMDAVGNILWRAEHETAWRLLHSASALAPATVE